MEDRHSCWRRLGAAFGAAALVVTASCDRGKSAAPRVAAATAAGAPASWELVYERFVDGEMELFVIPAGGGIERRLTHNHVYDGLARWTPDGRRIVFSSGRSGATQLWEIDADGRRPRRLRPDVDRDFKVEESQADVSPDGRQLVLISNVSGFDCLVLQDLVTGRERELVRHDRDTIFGNPHWSPDGRRITYSSNHSIGHQIYWVDAGSGREHRLSGLSQGGCEPRFSRDGKKVVYVSRGHMWPTSRLVEHDLATGKERPLVSWPALNYDPVYSPDGSEIAFASNITGQYAIYRQRLADGQAWRVTFAPGEARYPDYRPVH
jgi:TolB protein